jgi:hypothetical protein
MIAAGTQADVTRSSGPGARQKKVDENNTSAKDWGQLLPLNVTPIDPTPRVEELPRLTGKGHSLIIRL